MVCAMYFFERKIKSCCYSAGQQQKKSARCALLVIARIAHSVFNTKNVMASRSNLNAISLFQIASSPPKADPRNDEDHVKWNYFTYCRRPINNEKYPHCTKPKMEYSYIIPP